MAPRKLTRAEERRLRGEAEGRVSGDDRWDFAHPKRVRVSRNASAVLSVRMPYERVRLLRAMAKRNHLSMSDLVKAALEEYTAARGPDISNNRQLSRLRVLTPSGSPPETLPCSWSDTLDHPTSTDLGATA
ncbi:MAG TPA: ribbon-helix-helix protein, CopG family [Dehalococcoidia bacterium]|nr:ribbon-helix-helix protein, CopG family [Dehalococcoidia bacterium]